jgi:hypothetical protein
MHKIQNKNKQNQTNTTQKTIKISNEPKMGVTPGVHEESAVPVSTKTPALLLIVNYGNES